MNGSAWSDEPLVGRPGLLGACWWPPTRQAWMNGSAWSDEPLVGRPRLLGACWWPPTRQAWMNGSAWVDQACSELAGGRIREFSLLVATNPSSLDEWKRVGRPGLLGACWWSYT